MALPVGSPSISDAGVVGQASSLARGPPGQAQPRADEARTGLKESGLDDTMSLS
jgi:hypothetical protein